MAILIEIPASIGLILSLLINEASFGEIIVPEWAITVSLLIHILPWSILVGTFASLNSESTGPGEMPVLPAGIMISLVATSPPFAGKKTLFLSKIKFSLNGLTLVNKSAHWPSRF